MEHPLYEPQDLSRVSPLLAVFVFALLALRFFVVVVIAKKFGMTEIADVLFIAQLIPITLLLQNRKALMLSVVPVYTEYIVQADDEEVWHFTNQVVNMFMMVGIVITGLYILFAPVFMRPLVIGFSPEQRMLTIQFTRLLAPAMLFFIVFSLEESILYSYKHYTTTSWTILVGILGGLLGLLFLTDRYGIFGYGYGSLAGYFLQFAIPLTLFWKYRHKFRLSLNFKDPGLKKLYKILFPIYLFSLFSTLIHLTSRAFATTLGTGRVSAFQYCVTLTGVLPLILTQSVLAPLYPIVSEKVVRKEMEDLKDLLVKCTQVLFFVVAPIVTAMMCLRVPVIRLLFQRGEFNVGDTRLTADTLFFFAPFILPMTLNALYAQIIVSLGLFNAAAKLVFTLVFVNLLLCLGLTRFLDVGGIALSMTLVYFFMSWVLIRFVRARIGAVGFHRLVNPSLKVLAACFLSVLPLLYLAPKIEQSLDMSRLLFQFAGLGLEGVLFVALYVFFVWAFRMEEVGIISQLMKTKKEKPHAKVSLSVMGSEDDL